MIENPVQAYPIDFLGNTTRRSLRQVAVDRDARGSRKHDMYMGQRTVIELPLGQAARSGEGFKVGVDWSSVRIDVVSVSVTDMSGIAQHYPIVDGSLSTPNRLAIVG